MFLIGKEPKSLSKKQLNFIEYICVYYTIPNRKGSLNGRTIGANFDKTCISRMYIHRYYNNNLIKLNVMSKYSCPCLTIGYTVKYSSLILHNFDINTTLVSIYTIVQLTLCTYLCNSHNNSFSS